MLQKPKTIKKTGDEFPIINKIVAPGIIQKFIMFRSPQHYFTYSMFSNSSNHPIKFNGEWYSSSEHLYQASKFYDDKRAIEYIRNCNPQDIINYGHIMSSKFIIRNDWQKIIENNSQNNKILLLWNAINTIYNNFLECKDGEIDPFILHAWNVLTSYNKEIIDNNDFFEICKSFLNKYNMKIKDWNMLCVVYLKIMTHSDVMMALIETHDAILIYHVPGKDSWSDCCEYGENSDFGNGKNKLGIIFMMVRYIIRINICDLFEIPGPFFN